MRNSYKMLVGKPKGKRPLWRPRSKWNGNIKMDIKETGHEVVGWVYVAQDRVK
jgi:hypothetical protein